MSWKIIYRLILCLFLVACSGGGGSGGEDDGGSNGDGPDTTRPTIQFSAPAANALLSGLAAITANAQDDVGVASVDFYIDDQLEFTDSSSPYTHDWDTQFENDGSHSLKVVARDAASNTNEASITVTVDNTDPLVTITAPSDGETVSGTSIVQVNATDTSGIDRVELLLNNTLVNTDDATPFEYSLDTTLHSNAIYIIEAVAYDNAGLSQSHEISITIDNGLPQPPPDPSTQATTPNPYLMSSMGTDTAFLYSGSDPIQTGVAQDTIQPKRVAVIRGKVMDRDNNPLPSVTITIHGHPEFGQTISRVDGMFDMAVNGGGALTLNYVRIGYLPIQRTLDIPWRDYVPVPDVVMVELDSQVTVLDLDSQAMQMAQGGEVTDDDGTRQATLLMPPGTTAELVFPDGSTQSLSSLSVRATEYTVGENGPLAMPAPLPPTSGYTYALELSADEALAAGAERVTFNQPLYFYVEDFIGFPVGSAVPTGFYDRTQAQWVASKNGRVVKILSIDNNMAQLDTDGDNIADDQNTLAALQVTEEERTHLAYLYSAGQQLWRVPMEHFSTPDCNWFQRPPDDTEDPDPDLLNDAFDLSGKDDDESCKQLGYSTINCQGRSLKESVSIAGTPFSVNYCSRRVEGDKRSSYFKIRLVGDTLPEFLEAIRVHVNIAGRVYEAEFDSPTPNQEFLVEWDGLNQYGQPAYGTILANIVIEYGYPNNYWAYESTYENGFARVEGVDLEVPPVAPARTLFWKNTGKLAKIFRVDAEIWALDRWSLDVHHVYDTKGNVIYFGEGSRLGTGGGALNRAIQSVTTQGLLGFSSIRSTEPVGITTGPDGSIYVTDTGWHHIWRLPPDGNPEFFAGTPNSFGYEGDGGLARAAKFSIPMGLATGPDGSVYVADAGNNVIRRVTPDGLINTVAGNGTAGYSGDGGPAISAQLDNPVDVAVSNDGSLYIADRYNNRVRWVGTDGVITTLAGIGTDGFSGDGGPAKDAQLDRPTGIDVTADGRVYIADYGNRRVRMVGSDGIITTIAGNGFSGITGDGGPAVDATLTPWDVEYSAGALFVTASNRIRRIGPEGFISNEAGGADCFDFTGCYSGDNGPGPAASLNKPRGIDVLPNGELVFVDGGNYVVRSLQATLPGFSTADITVASGDGNQLYHFLPNGQHKRTLNTRTGSVVYEFDYDAEGRLTTITDADGLDTIIEQDGSGHATAIVGPYGHRTELTLDANHDLVSIKDPNNDTYTFRYTDGSLLTQKEDPEGFVFDYTYDQIGALAQADASDGYQHRLQRSPLQGVDEVTVSTALDHDTVYLTSDIPGGGIRYTTTYPTGLQLLAESNTDGSQVQTAPDGTTTEMTLAPDSRWGMQAPIISQKTVTTPDNLQSMVEITREVMYSIPGDPLSMLTQTDTMVINGNTYTQVQDVTTGEVTTTTPLLRESVYTLDDDNRILSYQGPGLAEIELSYDGQGRPEAISMGAQGDPEARTFGYAYDADGNMETFTDSLLREFSLTYDPVGRVTSIITPDARTIVYGYNGRGELTSLTPPGKPTHFISFAAGRMMASYDPPGLDNSTLYHYDSERKLTSVERQGTTAVTYGYMDDGRRERLTLPRGDIFNTYEPATGKQSQITTPEGNALSFTWDGFLLKSQTWAGDVMGSTAFTYNSDFHIAGVQVNNTGEVTYIYNDDGLLTQAGSLTMDRDPDSGTIQGTTLANVATTIGYNQFKEITAESASHNATSLFSADYTRDKLGRVLTKIETIQGTTSNYAYAYDAADRLETVSLNGAEIANYSYDDNGNRTGQVVNSVSTSASFDMQDRLLSFGGTAYTYTDNGELLTKSVGADPATTYAYDALGNLLSVVLPDGTSIEYIVDGRNQRIAKQVDGTLVKGFLYQDTLKPIAELDSSNNVVSRFVYGFRRNVPEYMLRGGATYRLITDRLGSVRLVVNTDDGTVAQRMDYDAFGKVLNDTNPDFQPFGFAGGLYDSDTGLVRFGVRDYDAETGRWTSKDPIYFDGGDTNLYRHARGDPVNFVDPQGMWSSPHQIWCKLIKMAERMKRCKAGAFCRPDKWDPDDPYEDGVDPLDAFDALDLFKDIIEEAPDILDKIGIDIESPIPLEWVTGAIGAGTKGGRQAAENARERHSDHQNVLWHQ